MKELEFVERVLRESSRLVRPKYAGRAQIAVTSKSEINDLLTETDLAVQDFVVAEIRKTFPHDEIVAEERDFARVPRDREGRCWVIDPIDGTQNLVRGLLPAFGISVALAKCGKPVVGGVALPIMGGIFLAERGAGAWRNGQPLRVSAVSEVAGARVEIDFSGRGERDETLRRASTIIRRAGQIRCNCSTVVALCSVAAGEMEAFVHVSLNPWDYAAGCLLVEEAGGATSRLTGEPLHLFDGRKGVLATNGLIDEELRGLLDD